MKQKIHLNPYGEKLVSSIRQKYVKVRFSPPAQDLTNHSVAKIPVYFGLYNI